MSTYEFGVKMACESCSNAINRVVSRLDGVKNISISLPDQTVRVEAEPKLSYQTVYDTIAKTGKPINYGKEL